MLHDHDAFGHVSRLMRRPSRIRPPVELPSPAELIRRLEEARAGR